MGPSNDRALEPPSGAGPAAREILRVWTDDESVWISADSDAPWTDMACGGALALAGELFARARAGDDEERFFGVLADVRDGFNIALNEARPEGTRFVTDDWGCSFKTRFVRDPEGAAQSVLAKEFPELFAACADDETAIVYVPRDRMFGLAILDGGPSVRMITHDPFTGRALPKALGDEWWDTVEAHLGREYEPERDAATLPDEFRFEAWWIARGL